MEFIKQPLQDQRKLTGMPIILFMQQWIFWKNVWKIRDFSLEIM